MAKWRIPVPTGDSSGPSGSRLRRLGRRLVGRMRSASVPAEATVTFVPARGGVPVELRVETGDTLLAIARAHQVDLASYCGGQCSCGTCRVGIKGAEGSLSPRTPNEAMVLGDAQVRAGERLACQARLLGDVTVELRDLF